MSVSPRRGVIERVLVDLNTQCDFLLPNGAMPVANRFELVPVLRRLMNWARVQRVPVISSLESHRPGESNDGLPRLCVDCTPGQKKLPFTLFPRRILLHGDNTYDVPLDPFRRYRQLIFTKRTRDLLANPKADRLINALDVKYFVVCGVITEHCVKAAVLGIIARQRRVVVVPDACGHWSAAEGELALRQMEAKGAIPVNSAELVSGEADERIATALAAMPVSADDDECVSAAPGAALTAGFGRGCSENGRDGNGQNGANGKPHARSRPLSIPAPRRAAVRVPQRRGKLA